MFLNVDEVIVKETFEKMVQSEVNKENEKAIKIYEEFGFKIKSVAYSMQL